MAQVLINVGTTPNDGTGDGIQIAGSKINDNFEDLYAKPSVLSDIRFFGNKLVTQLSNADIVFEPSGTGSIIMGNIRFNDNNIESINSNDNLNIVPNGTGGVKVAGIKVSTNEIQSWRSNDDIVFTPSGTGKITFGALSFSDNNITSARSNDDIKIIPAGTGSIIFDGIKFSGATISSDDSSTININEGLIVDGTLNVSGISTLTGAVTMASTLDVASGLTTLASLTTTGSTTLTGTVSIDNLSFNDNTVGSSSNADINITPGGTGTVNITSLTVDSNIKLFDNKIQTILSNADIILSASGSGSVTIPKIDLNEGTMDAVIGDTTPVAGTFTTLAFDPAAGGTLSTTGVTITDNDITSSLSNDNLEFRGSGTGGVSFNGLLLPNADGGTGQLLKTDGSGALSWGSSGIILGYSDIQDAKQTIGFASATQLTPNTAIIAHESIIGASASTIDSFDQTQYDSAWYLALTRMLSQDSSVEYSVAKYSILHGTSDGSTYDGFGSHSSITRTGDIEYFDGSTRTGRDAHIETSSDISESKLRLLGQGGVFADGSTRSSVNAVTAYRIGLGDDDSSITEGKATTVVHADLDSAEAAIDTWAHADYRGAKYFISVNNTTTNEVSNIECIVVHNGTSAFILSYNDIQSGNNSLITLAADINGSNVRLLGSNGSAGTCRVTMYRILLADDEADSTGTYINVIGEVEVTNTGKTTIDTNSFRGTATPDMSSQKVISSFTNTDYDSAWYHAVTKDSTNVEWSMSKWSLAHGTTNDGSTKDAFITDSSEIRTSHTPLTVMDVNISGSTVQLLATANNDGSTTIKNAITYYGIGLGDNTPTATSGKIGTNSGVTFGGNNETRVDTITATGTTTSILSTQRTIAEFTTSAYDSAWFLGVSNDVTNSGFATFKYSVMHGTTSDGSTQDAFITSSSVTRTDISHNHLETDADISGSDVRLLGNGGRLDDSSKSTSNTMAYYRIGLGDSDSSGYTSDDGNADTDVVTVGGIQETTIDHVTATGTHATLSASGTTTCAEFTAGQYNGALFYVVSHDVANGSFETQKISMAHNLNDSFMTGSSIVSTDEGDQHPVYTTDMVTSGDSTSKIRLRSTDSDGSTVSANNTMAYYRIGIGDDDSTGYAGELGLVNDIMHVDIIDSTVTNLDTWTKASHCGAKYFINVKNQSTGETSNIEALVTHNNTDAFITSYNEHFSGNNSLITLTADVDGTSVRLRGSATAGGSTKVIVNRIVAFGDTEATEATTDSTRKVIGNVVTSSTATEFDTFQSSDTDAVHYVITGQGGTNENYICEASVVTDGTGVFVSQGPSISTKDTGPNHDLLIITATIAGGTVSVKAASTSGATVVQAYAVRLKAPESSTATIDSWSASTYRGAKYFISLNNLDSNEMSNIECMVVHDGTTAFINEYNEHFSGSASLITLSADISGGNVRLRCGVAQDNTRVTFYKIILADAETDITGGTNVNVIGDVTVSSTATAVDTFVDTDIDGAHYVIIGYNASEGAASIQEANVITNGTTAFVSSGPYVSTKGTNQLDLTAAHDGSSTVTLSAASTSGGSTKVNAYRIHMKAPTGQTDNLDTWAKGTYRGAKYYISAKETITGYTSNIECLVVHDGTTAYINDFNEHFSHVSLVTLTADISGSNVRVRCAGNIPDVKVKWYRILLGDGESDSTGTDTKVVGAVTVSSTATAIDTFVDTSYTGAHYVIVGYNSGEASASISEATVLTDGTNAYVAQGPEVSTKDSHHLTLTAAHDGSSTVTLSASASSGGSTTVNAFRIHMLRGDGASYTELDEYASATYQGAHYVIVGKNASTECQIAEITTVTDGVSAYITQTGTNISTHSTTSPLMTFTADYEDSKLKLRAENSQEGTSTTVNAWRVHLSRGDGDTSGIKILDTWDATVYRSAKYTVSISDASNERYETLDLNLVHDGSNCFLSTYGRVTNHSADLVTFSANIVSNDVNLKGQISNTDSHDVTVVRRVMVI